MSPKSLRSPPPGSSASTRGRRLLQAPSDKPATRATTRMVVAPRTVECDDHVMARYVIYGGRPGYDRLKVLARRWQATTSALLDDVGVGAGMRCLDLGCGAGDVTFELARRVGASGRVVGLDLDAAQLDLTRAESQRIGLDNIDLRVGDVTAIGDGSGYDVVYSRNVIQHLGRPVDAIRGMWEVVRPGGVLVAEDVDFEGAFCEPRCAGHDFWLETYQATLRASGGDPLSGRRLFARFREAGVPTPQVTVVQCLDFTGEAKFVPYLTVEGTATTMVELGVAAVEEIESALVGLRAMAEDETSLCGSPRMFQAWSRRLM
jgi:ubiquinone/menaquinone biosynthesis C-methylase UbiE